MQASISDVVQCTGIEVY